MSERDESKTAPAAMPLLFVVVGGAALLLWGLGLVLQIFYGKVLQPWLPWMLVVVGTAGFWGSSLQLLLTTSVARRGRWGLALCSVAIPLLTLGVWLRLQVLTEGSSALGRGSLAALVVAALGAFWFGSYLLFRRNIFGPFLALIMVWTLFFVIAPDAFHGLYNTKTYVAQAAIIGIGALGMCLVIISGGIDLSVGSIVALATVVVALVLVRFEDPTTIMAVSTAVLAAILVGGLCGAFNGALTASINLVPFIVTLGALQMIRGIALGLAHNQTVSVGKQTCLSAVTKVTQGLNPLDLPFAVWLLLILTVVMALVLRHTVYGRYVYALGSNENTARLCGVPVLRYRVITYTLCGLFTGLAGVIQFGRLSTGDPTAANGMELQIIAAVVIGGGSLSGGEGGAFGCLVGALLIRVLENGCNQLGLPNWTQFIVIGAVIGAAAAIDRLKHRQRA